MLFAVYMRSVRESRSAYPLGLFDEIHKARKRCARECKSFDSVTITETDIDWHEWTDDSSNFSHAVGTVTKGRVWLQFYIDGIKPMEAH